MARKILPGRGFKDLLPEEKVFRETVINEIKRVYTLFGFAEIETPCMEPIERLSSSQGGDNEKMVFRVLKRGMSPGESIKVEEASDLGLRYDLTLPLSRYYSTNKHLLPNVFRSMQIGSVWRAERPQKGRYRQFIQCDIDIIGDATVLAEVELINATTYLLNALGIKGLVVRLNDRRILDGILRAFSIPEELRGKALIIIDKLDKIGFDGVLVELGDLGIPQNTVDSLCNLFKELMNAGRESFTDTLNMLPSECSDVVKDELISIYDMVSIFLDGSPIKLVFDPSLVRGMGYYTGAIFEIEQEESSSSICGGGRYDEIGGKLFGYSVPACGFSIGFERILDLIDKESVSEKAKGIALIYEGKPSLSLISFHVDFVNRDIPSATFKKAKNFKRQVNELKKFGFERYCFVKKGIESIDELDIVDIS